MKHSKSGIHVLHYLTNEGLKIFTIAQAKNAARQLDLNTGYVAEALHHLLKEGWITRIKRGVYALSVGSGFGEPPHEFEIALALVANSAISHWTAMHYHHLTQQTPNTIFAITPTSTSIPRSIPKGKYHFIKIKEDHFFGIETVWVGQTRIQITDPERTLLDGLMTPQFCGDFQEVLHAFKMRGNQINLERIIQYALRFGGVAVKRLGWVLEKIGIKESSLKCLLELPIKGYRRLDSFGPIRGPYNKKWMIQENIGVI